MSAGTLTLAAGGLLLAGLLIHGAQGRWKPPAVLLAVASLSLPIKALFVAFIPVPAWAVLTAACVTAAFFIAWQVHQKQTKTRP